MGIRMSGLVSNLDTDTIVKELMSAQRMKKTKIENKVTKLDWKTEKWKELNTKIYSLYTGSLSKMRLQGNYKTKKATSSDESKVTVTADSTAVNGSHTLQIKQIASAQYMTGKAIKTSTDGNVKGTTKLVDLKDSSFTLNQDDSGKTINSSIIISTEKKTVNFDISESSTVDDFLLACKNAGINASFDTNQNRFFISSSSSGVENTFSITSATSETATYRVKLRDAVGYSSFSDADKTKFDKALEASTNAEETAEDREAAKKVLDSFVDRKTTKDLTEAFKNGIGSDEEKALMGTYKESAISAYEVAVQKAEEKYMTKHNIASADDLNRSLKSYKDAIETAVASAAKTFVSSIKANAEDVDNPYNVARDSFDEIFSDYEGSDSTITETFELDNLGLTSVKYNSDNTYSYYSGTEYTNTAPTGISAIEAKDSIVVYNGAELVSSSSTITANGLTMNLKGETAVGETISIALNNDTDAVYSMVKDFIKEYNTLLDEMNTLYGAKSARGYDPLTSEQKEAMTDDEVEKWETKIKDSLLRRDDTLSSVMNSLKAISGYSTTVNGKSYSLASFGISSALYTEKGKLHINGDKDDTLVADEKDKLMKAIQEDPETVTKVLNEISSKLYDDLQGKMRSSSISSALTFYNDKEMSKTKTKYEDEMDTLEDRLKDMEDRYYKQFSAMETAMSKLNSQSNQLSSLIGSNS